MRELSVWSARVEWGVSVHIRKNFVVKPPSKLHISNIMGANLYTRV